MGSEKIVLPLLPLRDIIVFPFMVLPLFVGRDKSILALEKSMAEQKSIFLSAQRNPNNNEPQAADIFELGVDIALGGMDQRKAHMFMREVAEKNHWIKPTCIHTPMLSGLKGPGGRMDSFDHKMSKSDPGNALLLDDDPESIRVKMRKAFLEVGNQHSPVFEISRHVIIPKLGKITVTPDPKYGETSEWYDAQAFIDAVSDGTVHPLDAKMAVADCLSVVLSPISEHFSGKTELLESINSITGVN